MLARIKIGRQAFYEMVWNTPATMLSADLELTIADFTATCPSYDIPRPPLGYWQKIRFGKPSLTP